MSGPPSHARNCQGNVKWRVRQSVGTGGAGAAIDMPERVRVRDSARRETRLAVCVCVCGGGGGGGGGGGVADSLKHSEPEFGSLYGDSSPWVVGVYSVV